jgi:tetratricopeptide (TPR) repeat protein
MSQHPDVERFRTLYQAARYDEALTLIDGLIKQFPNTAVLHWHRACCLEKLQRHLEAAQAVDAVLALKADVVPALLKRAELAEWKVEAAAPELAAAIQQQAQADLQKVLQLEPDNSRALYLSCTLLPDLSEAERSSRLDRAVALAPAQVEYRAARAQRSHGSAMVAVEWEGDTEPPVAPTHVRTYSGARYDRARLAAAREDYLVCWQQGGEYRHALKAASISHDLGEYAEALQLYDAALAKVPADAPFRDFIREQRARSENNGGGERDQLAALLLSGVADGKNRNQADDMAVQALRGMAESMRQGKSIADALATNLSEDPDTMTAMNIARQILNVANEPEPCLEPVQASQYPAYQRRHCDAVSKDAARLGLGLVADAEARGMFGMLGQHVLIRIFANGDGDIGMASFAMKPKWPGVLAFLLLLFTGKWKVQRMTECVTQFDDGSCISTQPESISPFEYGGKVHINRLPAGTPVAQLFARHVQFVSTFRARNPALKSLRALDLAGVEARWIAGQESKAQFRRSIGYVTDGELRKVLGVHHDRFAAKVRAQIRSMAG